MRALSRAIAGEVTTGPFPAMVIMHSSRGLVGSIWDWAKLFNDMGVASFVVDSFTPRGLTENSADQLAR